VLTEKSGKMVPEKVGMKAIQRDGYDYENTLVFDLNIKNYASASKDRTGLFDEPPHRISVTTGIRISEWCNKGFNTSEYITNRIEECSSIDELLDLYKAFPGTADLIKPVFEARKRQLLNNNNHNKTINNGTHGTS
jgi:hypothetical protein